MGTGASFVRITNKRILGQTDLDEWFIQYLRNSHQESVAARWNADGVFAIKLTLSSPGADTVQVDGTSLSSDGSGHIIDIANIYPDRTALFENTAAIDYEVGLGYIEVPEGIRINPRTGKPEYDHSTEHIGESADPDAVVDNGNGTLTLTVNSVTESGVDNAGRVVRVYKKILADDALTESIAIEELTVAFGAGDNKITTVAGLGQTVISTTASDYTVVLMGISVKRNTSIQASDFVYIGTVTGNGGTPTVFDITNQGLFKTFQDASQIVFAPYQYLTSTDVQSAIQEMVDDLGAAGSAAAGSTRVGMDGSVFTKRLATAVTDDMGMGNIADSTFTSSSHVQNALVAIDAVLAHRRSNTLTLCTGSGRTKADIASPTALHQLELASATYAIGGTYWLQGAGKYLVGDGAHTGINASEHPYVLGEYCGDTFITQTEVELQSIAVQNYDLHGEWKRIYFRSNHATYYFLGKAGFVAEDCTITSGDVVQDSAMNTRNAPFEYRRVSFSNTEAGAHGVGFSVESFGANVWTHGLVEGCYIEGPQPAHGSPIASLYINDLGTNIIDKDTTRALTFRNCYIVQTNIVAPALYILDSPYPVVFDNCTFRGMTGSTVPLIKTLNANASFRNCRFYAESGQALELQNHFGVLEGCVIGTGADTTVSDPVAVRGHGYDTDHPLVIRDMYIELNTGAVRPTSSPTNTLVEFGGVGGVGEDSPVHVDGLYIQQANSTGLHATTTLRFHGSSSGNVFRNVTFNFNNQVLKTPVANGIVIAHSATDRDLLIDGLALEAVWEPASIYGTTPVLRLARTRANNISVDGAAGGAGRYQDFVRIEDDCIINGLFLDTVGDFDRAAVAFVGDDSTLRDLSWESLILTPTGAQHVYIGGDSNLIDGVQGATGWGTGVLFEFVGNRCAVTNAMLESGAAPGSAVFQATAGAGHRVTGNTVKTVGTTVTLLNFTVGLCMVMGNILQCAVGPSVIVNSGGGSIGDATTNVLG